MLWGERTLTIEGNMIFEDKENGIKAVIFFGGKKPEEYTGKLYYYDISKNL